MNCVCARLLAAVLALACALPGVVMAQSAPASTDANVTPYAPAFFAEFRPVTALDMIGRIPGFQFDGGSSARGFAGTAGNVLIDGERPPTRSDALSTVLSRIPASQVLRIDVVRGGAGGIDMQGKAVVANVIRRPDAGVTGAMSSGLSVMMDGRLSPNASIQAQRQRDGRSIEGSFRLNGGSQSYGGQRTRFNPAGDVILLSDNDGVVDYSGGEANTVYEGPLGGGRIRANALINYNDSQYDSTDRLLLPVGLERSTGDDSQWKGEAGLRWTRSLGSAALELIAFQQVIQSEGVGAYDTPGFTSDTVSNRRSGETIFSGALRFAPRGRWTLETGSEIALNWVESATAYALDDSPVLLPGDDTRVEELRSESFVTGVWAPRPEFSVETTLRYETSRITASGSAGEGETALDYLKPRVNLTWTPRPRNTLTLKLEKNVDQLSFGAFTASAAFSTGIYGRGNPDIRPAQSWLLAGRYEWTFDRQGSLIVELNHEELDDVLGSVIVTEIPPGGTTPVSFNITRNVGSARRNFLRLSGRLPMDRYGFDGGMLTGQVYWRKSTTEDPVTFVERRLNNETPFAWAVAWNQNLPELKLNWSLSASSGVDQSAFSPRTSSRSETTPSFSASLTYRPDPTLSLSGYISVNSYQESSFTLYDLPRNVGVPVYSEISTSPGQIQAQISVRRSF